MKIIVVILALFGACSGSSKQWQLDVNFNNPNNWDSGKTPCSTNRIIFPETVNAVLLQTNISSVKEVVLPNDGQILLLSDMILTFSDDDSADPGCDGGDVTFIRTNSESWFDPDNWQDLDDLISVETERVPCQYDSVIFPENKLFSVGLDSSVTIGSMSFSGKNYNTSCFGSFLASDAGKIQFTNSSSASVTVQGSTCPVTSGCACGNDNEVLKNKICNQYSCLATSCSDAVTPVGGCCALCGAILTIDYDTAAFNLATFKTMVRDTYHVHNGQSATRSRKRRASDTGEVATYTSKTSKDQIQMVLTDKAVGSSSGQTAINLAEQIMRDILNDLGSFGVTNVDMKSSRRGTGTQTGSLQGGAVAGIIIAVIIIVIVICTLGFLVIRRRSNFFTKDQPLHAAMDISPDIPVGFMEEIPGQPPAMYMQSFDNPVYAAPSTQAQDNLYDDPTRLPSVGLTSVDPGDIKKGSKKGKGLPPETLNQHDGTSGFDNPNYATLMETGIDDFRIEDDGAKGFDIGKQESET